MKKLLLGTATLITLGLTPVIPEELEWKYAYERPCVLPIPTEEEILDPTYSPPGEQPYTPKCTRGNVAIAVFEDKKGNEVYTEIPITQYRNMGKKGGREHNPKKSEFISVFENLAREAEAASPTPLGTVTTFASPSAATSHTFSHTVSATGQNRALIVTGFSSAGNNLAWDAVTYNGDSLSQIVSVAGSYAGGGIMFYMADPDTGTNNVVIGPYYLSGSRNTNAQVTTFQDMAQSSPVDTTGSACVSLSSTSISCSVTTTIDNSVVIGFTTNGTASGVTSDYGTALALNVAGAFARSHNASYIEKATAGSQTMGFSDTGATFWDMFITSLKYEAPSGGGGSSFTGQPVIWFE